MPWGEAGVDVGFGEGGADFASKWVVAGEGFVGAFENDDGFFSLQRIDDGGLGERTDDVDVDGAHLGAARRTEMVDGGFDVFGGGAQGDEGDFGVGRCRYSDTSP